MSKLIRYLSDATGLLAHDVRAIVARAPASYKRYTIPKRSGGQRSIAQPAREVKALQRALVDMLSHLPVHEAATAYKSGATIRENAARHAGSGPIMKYDFKDFFTSIRERDWLSYCSVNAVFSEEEDAALGGRLLFTNVPGFAGMRLAMGAPSSPWLSNVLMYDFDLRVTALLDSSQVTYTRYADDLTFSAKRTGYLVDVPRLLKEVIRATSHPRLSINEEKTVVATTKYRRQVTGLVLAADGRVTIGRERKRNIRAAIFQLENDALDANATEKLAGMLAFAKDVEREFYEKIIQKCPASVLTKLGIKR